MDIPNSISDMDSIPDTLSLSRNAGIAAVSAGLQAAFENFVFKSVPENVQVAQEATNAFQQLGNAMAAVEIAELEELFKRQPHIVSQAVLSTPLLTLPA